MSFITLVPGVNVIKLRISVKRKFSPYFRKIEYGKRNTTYRTSDVRKMKDFKIRRKNVDENL